MRAGNGPRPGSQEASQESPDRNRVCDLAYPAGEICRFGVATGWSCCGEARVTAIQGAISLSAQPASSAPSAPPRLLMEIDPNPHAAIAFVGPLPCVGSASRQEMSVDDLAHR